MKAVVEELQRRKRRKPPKRAIVVVEIEGCHEEGRAHAPGMRACWCLPDNYYLGEGVVMRRHRVFEN